LSSVKRINYIDLFSGIGGFRLALKNIRNKVKLNESYYSEIDKFAEKIYKRRFPGSVALGDVREINAKTLQDIDLVTFGFPCQDISVVGKRTGLGRGRDTLFNQAIRVIEECRPKYFIFENVKNLLSINRGADFVYILKTIADIGYNGEWQLCNTSWFLPQNRERIYFVGYPRGGSRPKVFPIGQGNKTDGRNKRLFDISSTLTANYANRHFGLGETYIKTNKGIRRLTPIEFERLQGFPDNWTKGISNTQRYKCLGNSISIPIAQSIINKLYV